MTVVEQEIQQENLPELNTISLEPNKAVALNLNVVHGAFDAQLPLKPNIGTSQDQVEHYPQPDGTRTLGVVHAGDSKFFVLDATNNWDIDGDIIVVDESFFKPQEDMEEDERDKPHAVKVKPGEPLAVGRSHHKTELEYSDSVSRNHFEVLYEHNGEVLVRNNQPTYGTKVTIPKAEVVASSAVTEEVNQGDITFAGPVQEIDREALDKMRMEYNLRGAIIESHEDVRGRTVVTLTKAGEYGEPDRKNEDYVLADLENELYGVFDGLGGSQGASDVGSKAAGESISKAMRVFAGNKTPELQLQALKDVIQLADVDVSAQDTSTTATVAKLIENPDGNGSKMVWASLGDSRIYVMSPGGELRQITEDEGYGKVVTNALGVFVDKFGRRHPAFDGVNQTGIEDVVAGSKIIMVSDGISGDFETDSLSLEEMQQAILKGGDDPTEIAKQLIGASIKIDDKSIVVIQA